MGQIAATATSDQPVRATRLAQEKSLRVLALFSLASGPRKVPNTPSSEGVADAEPVLLADEMMAQMVLLDPAAEPGPRLVGNVRDVMRPFIVQDRKHHPKQR